MKIEEPSLQTKSKWYNFVWSIVGGLSNKACLAILLIYPTSEARLFFPTGKEHIWVFWLLSGLGYVSRIFYPLMLSPVGRVNRIKENQIYNLIGVCSVLVYRFLPGFETWGWYSTFITLLIIAVQNICSSCDYPYISISTINSFPEDQRLMVGTVNSLPMPLATSILLQASEKIPLRQLSLIVFVFGLMGLAFKQFYLMDKITLNEASPPRSLKVGNILTHLGNFKKEIFAIVVPFLAFSYGFDQMSYKWWLEVMTRTSILASSQAKNALTICLGIATALKIYLLLFHRTISIKSDNLLRNISWYAMISLPMLYVCSIWQLPLVGLILNIPVNLILKGNVLSYFRTRISQEVSNSDLSNVLNLTTAVLQPIVYALPPFITYNVGSISASWGPVGNSIAYCLFICICGILSTNLSKKEI